MNAESIGSTLQKRRKFLKITQQELCERAGVSLRGLKQIESGEGNPTINQLTKILDVLGMKIQVVIK